MKHSGVAFSEIWIRLDQPDTADEIGKVSPTKRVPCLVHGDLTVWESLAICEYIADIFPEKSLWPPDVKARARARSVSAEMHGGFSSLRTVWPMWMARSGLKHLTTGGVKQDIVRIGRIWADCRREYGVDGPFLFGRFSVADAMFAPVVSRFVTYGPVDLPDIAGEYLRTIWDLPALDEWRRGGAAQIGG